MADQVDIAAENRARAEREQLESLREASKQQAARQARDNASAEALRTFGDEPLPRGKDAREEFLRGDETIAGPTGRTSSTFGYPPTAMPEGDEKTDAKDH